MTGRTMPPNGRPHPAEWPGSAGFGELVRAYRTRRGMTQRQLADRSTVSIRTIRGIEQGRVSRPRLGTVQLIADGLGLTGRSRATFEAGAGRIPTADLGGFLHSPEPAPPPAPLDTLVGREGEVEALRTLLATGSQRLVTVTGLGGVGKTRVALAVADSLHRSNGMPVLWTSFDGADPGDAAGWQCPPEHRSRLLAVGLAELFTSSGGAVYELEPMIRDRTVLLVLDGYRAAQIRVDRLIPLLQDCPGLRILLTSREPYGIKGELRISLPPLPVPAARDGHDPVSMIRVPSVQLLVRYVQRVQPTFELTAENAAAVGALCRHLDGIPAALAAVASWSLAYDLDTLAKYVRADPLSLVGRSAVEDEPTDLLRAVRQAIGSIDTRERGVLAELCRAGGGDAPSGAERPWANDIRTIRRLLALGLVRPADETPGRFVVPGLVRRLLAPLREDLA